MKPDAIAKQAMEDARAQNFEVLIVDTAGRMQIDEGLMDELSDVAKVVEPSETLLVVDAMMGQQAVDLAEGFGQRFALTGTILTKLDGDARGGAALSIVSVTGKPIKFVGMGERASDFEVFHPERISSRLLDMGDVLSLIEKAEKVISEDEAMEAAEKMGNFDNFTLEDFQKQMAMVSRMGPLSGLMKMLPGMGGMKEHLDSADTEGELKRINSIINSMTFFERRNPEKLNGSRRARIAGGCGREVQDVNQLVKRFLDAKKMMKQMGKMGNLMKGMAGGGEAPAGKNPFKTKRGKGFGRKL